MSKTVASILREGLERAMTASQAPYDPGPEAAYLADALAVIAGLRPCGADFTAELAEQMEVIALDALAHRDAQGIEAGTDETLQAAQPEGREPGGEAMRPSSSGQDR